MLRSPIGISYPGWHHWDGKVTRVFFAPTACTPTHLEQMCVFKPDLKPVTQNKRLLPL